MIFEYEDEGKAKVDMSSYVKNMLDDFPVKLKKSEMAATPAGENLYNRGQGKKLSKEDSKAFHTMVAKGLFVCRQARPDIQPMIALLCTRTKEPNMSDWNKLIRMMKYLNCMQDMKLKSNWRINDIQKRSGPVAIKEAEAQHKGQHRS